MKTKDMMALTAAIVVADVFGLAKGGRVMIAIWIAIGIVAALGLVTVYACIAAGSDADDESERWEETKHKEDKK